MRRRLVAVYEESLASARGASARRLLRGMLLLCALVLLVSGGRLCHSGFLRDLSVVRHYRAPTAHPAQDSSRLRVMAYNIAHGRGSRSFSGQGEFQRVFSHASRQSVLDNLRQVAGVIRAADASVVALNEVDVHNTSSFDLDFVEVLLSELSGEYPYAVHGTKWLFCMPFYQHHTGNAILSRYPLEEAENIDLGEGNLFNGLWGSHTALAATIRHAGTRVTVVTTHLESANNPFRPFGGENTYRTRQSGRLLAWTQGRPHLILAGDFNSVLSRQRMASSHLATKYADDGTMILIEEDPRWVLPPLEANPLDPRHFTAKTHRPTRTIDFIIPDTTFQIMAYDVIDADASDHRPVVAQLQIRARPQ